MDPRPPNLKGDRDVEYSWVAANMPSGPGEALDFGCGCARLSLVAAQKGFNVTAVDHLPTQLSYSHPAVRFIRGDLLEIDLSRDYYDLIINCSSIEHVGLSDRYGIDHGEPDSDLRAMAHLRNLLKPQHTMLLTMPVGQDSVFPPLHRVYGERRKNLLFADWMVAKAEFWLKDASNQWVLVDEDRAFNEKPSRHYYGLGLFVLRRPAF